MRQTTLKMDLQMLNEAALRCGRSEAGFECGIPLANNKDVKAGDILECFITEKVAAVLFH